jgi:hypothetical protein
VPLRQAVFAFGIPDFLPLQELTATLQNKSGAQAAEIDTDNATFSFHFFSEDGKEEFLGGPPWELLPNPLLPESSITDPWLDAEALFNKEGIARISDDEAENLAKRLEAVREATGLVWNQFLLRTFDQAVSSGSIILHARPHRVSARFKRLPADVWPVLEVSDWQNGVAIAPDGTSYWSVHAEPAFDEKLSEDATVVSESVAQKAADERRVTTSSSAVPKPVGSVDATAQPDSIKGRYRTSASEISEPAEQQLGGRNRGRPASVGPRVEAAMRADVKKKRFGLSRLNSMTEKELTDRYKASRTTCSEARKRILSEEKDIENDT